MSSFTNERVQELMVLGPFKGIDATTTPYYVDPEKFIDAVNIVPDRAYQGYVTAQGRVQAITGPLASAPFGMAKFSRSGHPTVYIAVVNLGGTPPFPGLQQFTIPGGTPAPLFFPASVVQIAFKPVQFVAADRWLFLSPQGLNDTPLKIVFDTLAVTNWGIQPPTSAPTVTATGVGVLNFSGYQYTVTFGVNQAGTTIQESSPAPSSTLQAPLSIVNQQASLAAIPVSSDPQVNERNIYRIDSGGQFRLVGVISDNVTTTFTDNTPDSGVTGQALVLNRDPPQAFFSITNFQNSIWGFGFLSSDPSTQSALWYSNPSEPWGFNSADQVFSVGENSGGDIAVAVASTGTILLCLKTKTTWILEGTPGNYTQPYFIFDIGCASSRSVAQAQGTIFWLSPDPGVYAFNGGAPVYLSRDIKGFLDTLTLTDMQASVGFYRDRCYLISFPTKNVTWMYDTILQSWWKLGWATDCAVYDAENQGEVTADDAQAPGVIESWFAADTDLGLPITSSVTSRLADSGNAAATKQYRYALVVAPPQAASASLLVTVDPGPRQKYRNAIFSLAGAPQVTQISLPGWMKGREAQLQLTLTTSAKTQIQKVSLHGWIERLFGGTG